MVTVPIVPARSASLLSLRRESSDGICSCRTTSRRHQPRIHRGRHARGPSGGQRRHHPRDLLGGPGLPGGTRHHRPGDPRPGRGACPARVPGPGRGPARPERPAGAGPGRCLRPRPRRGPCRAHPGRAAGRLPDRRPGGLAGLGRSSSRRRARKAISAPTPTRAARAPDSMPAARAAGPARRAVRAVRARARAVELATAPPRLFAARYRHGDGEGIIPTIVGRGYICGEATLVRQPGDPFAEGISLGSTA